MTNPLRKVLKQNSSFRDPKGSGSPGTSGWIVSRHSQDGWDGWVARDWISEKQLWI